MSINGTQSVQTYHSFGRVPDTSSGPFQEALVGEGAAPAAEPPSHQPDEAIAFKQDQVSGEMLMTLVDPDSGDVVRQIPPEEFIDISRVLGLLFDRVA